MAVDTDLEQLLAGLASEEELEPEAQKVEVDNSVIKRMRAELDRRDKQIKKDAAALREYREKESARLLDAAGLTPGQAKAFLAMNEAVTPENIESFKTDVLGVQTPPPSEESAKEGQAASAASTSPALGFAPTSSGGQPSLKVYSPQETIDLFFSDRALYEKMREAGRTTYSTKGT